MIWLIFGVSAFVGLVLVLVMRWDFKQGVPAPESTPKRPQIRLNDKIIAIPDVDLRDCQKILQDFCDMYNKEVLAVRIRLCSLDGRSHLLAFPHDIDPWIYFYLVNNIAYPFHFEKQFHAIGWLTLPHEEGIPIPLRGLYVMVYVDHKQEDKHAVNCLTAKGESYLVPFYKGCFTRGNPAVPVTAALEFQDAPAILEGLPCQDFQ